LWPAVSCWTSAEGTLTVAEVEDRLRWSAGRVTESGIGSDVGPTGREAA
jgi:hypothetical protein